MKGNKTSQSWAIGALLLGSTMWGVVWYPMRLLEIAGLSGLWLSLFLYLGALAITSLKTVPQLKYLWQEPLLMVQLAAYAGWTNVAFILAVLDGNVLRVLLLFYLTPLWAVMFGYLFLGERLSRISIITLVVALAGAVLMLWHPDTGIPWPTDASDWLALSSGMAFAASNVIIRKTQAIELSAKVAMTWVGVIAISVLLILVQQVPVPVGKGGQIGSALLLGAFGMAVMTTLVQYGVTHMPVHRSAVILLFELVAGAISQQLLTDEIMTLREWLGGAAIMVAAWVSGRYG
ncbi:MAG: DMT family transporter [Gammaproteobacteria bacterium]|nr:DMT family transporter [Gammaproteobacteria bacterium]